VRRQVPRNPLPPLIIRHLEVAHILRMLALIHVVAPLQVEESRIRDLVTPWGSGRCATPKSDFLLHHFFPKPSGCVSNESVFVSQIADKLFFRFDSQKRIWFAHNPIELVRTR
jgi:hypothetical protein